MGIGEGFDILMYWTAGAVVSGAFFGDKVSPLSDTTNLAPAVTGTDVFSHIKNMMATTIPAMVLAFLIYLGVGFFVIDQGPDVDAAVQFCVGGIGYSEDQRHAGKSALIQGWSLRISDVVVIAAQIYGGRPRDIGAGLDVDQLQRDENL